MSPGADDFRALAEALKLGRLRLLLWPEETVAVLPADDRPEKRAYGAAMGIEYRIL